MGWYVREMTNGGCCDEHPESQVLVVVDDETWDMVDLYLDPDTEEDRKEAEAVSGWLNGASVVGDEDW